MVLTFSVTVACYTAMGPSHRLRNKTNSQGIIEAR
jgi:hypothetical protein